VRGEKVHSQQSTAYSFGKEKMENRKWKYEKRKAYTEGTENAEFAEKSDLRPTRKRGVWAPDPCGISLVS